MLHGCYIIIKKQGYVGWKLSAPMINYIFKNVPSLFDQIVHLHNVKLTETGFSCSQQKVLLHGQKHNPWQLLLGHVVLSIEPQSNKESLGSSQCFFVTLQCQMSYSGTFMSKVMLLPSMAVVGQWLAVQEKKTEGNFRPITLQWLGMDQGNPFCVLVQNCPSSTQVRHFTKQGDAEKKRNGLVTTATYLSLAL